MIQAVQIKENWCKIVKEKRKMIAPCYFNTPVDTQIIFPPCTASQRSV